MVEYDGVIDALHFERTYSADTAADNYVHLLDIATDPDADAKQLIVGSILLGRLSGPSRYARIAEKATANYGMNGTYRDVLEQAGDCLIEREAEIRQQLLGSLATGLNELASS